jgi:nucleoid-associated protein YgaU
MTDKMPDFSDVKSGSSSTASSEKIYEVQSGDSLSKIAKREYGNANEWRRIFEANQDVLTDPDKIKPGQKLRIPSL